MGVMFFFVLVVAFSRALLAPDIPEWRLLDVIPENAFKIHRRIVFLAAIASLDIFLWGTKGSLKWSDELISIYTIMFGCLELAAIASLAKGSLWESDAPVSASKGEEGSLTERTRLVLFIRRGALTISFIALATMIAGYAGLGEWLLSRLILSGLIFSLITLLWGLFYELVDLVCGSENVRKKSGFRLSTMENLKSWLHLMLETFLYVIGGLSIIPLWGVPREDLLRWTGQILTGFSVGNIWISFTDIALAFVVFIVAMGIARVIQRLLVGRVLSQTGLAVSVQQSLTAGFGYLGVVLALLISISITGINLSHFAMVAGALSVGIGFGLQNIVNNFVSGLILLVERPIKVGDWVVVGGHEGFVKRISFRATEMDTWQRSSVIIPNAEIISTSVVNLTHKDHYGRIEIQVGVAYGSDTGKVQSVLLECAQNNQEVLDDPEPIVLFSDFGSSSLDFELRCFTASVTRRRLLASELRFAIDQRFREEGIQIPFPQRVLHLPDGNKMT
jgi:small-conductance mechanosensitive channel